MTEIEAVVGEKTYVSYEDITKCEYTYAGIIFNRSIQCGGVRSDTNVPYNNDWLCQSIPT